MVRNIEDGAGRMTVNELDAEDLGLRKGGADFYSEVWCLSVRFRICGSLVRKLVDVLNLS